MQFKEESSNTILNKKILNAVSELIKVYTRNGSGKYITWSSNDFFADKNYKKILQNLNVFYEILINSKQCFDDMTVILNLLISGSINYKTDPHYLESFLSVFSPYLEKLTQSCFANLNLDYFTPYFFPASPQKQLDFMGSLLQEMPEEHKLKQTYIKTLEDGKILLQKNTILLEKLTELEKKSFQDIKVEKQLLIQKEKQIENLKSEVFRLKKTVLQQSELIKAQNVLGNLAKVFENGKEVIDNQQTNNSSSIFNNVSDLENKIVSPPPVPQGEPPKVPEFKSKLIIQKKGKKEVIQPHYIHETNQLHPVSFMDELKYKHKEIRNKVNGKSGCDIVFMEFFDQKTIVKLEKKSNAIYVVTPESIIYYNQQKDIYQVVAQEQKQIILFIIGLNPNKTIRQLNKEELKTIHELIQHSHDKVHGDTIQIAPTLHQHKTTMLDTVHRMVTQNVKKIRPQVEDSEEEESGNEFSI